MHSPQLQENENGRIHVSGELTFETAPALSASIAEIFEAGKNLIIDFQEVGRTDSAGLALLIEWRREAAHRQCELGFENVPQQLLALAHVSGVAGLLSLQ